MSNPLFNMLNGNQTNIFQQFQQFQKTFQGNPHEKVQEMLKNGQISQAQYDAAAKKANEFMRMFGTSK